MGAQALGNTMNGTGRANTPAILNKHLIQSIILSNIIERRLYGSCRGTYLENGEGRES